MPASYRRLEPEEEKYTAARSGNRLKITDKTVKTRKSGAKVVTGTKDGKKVRVVRSAKGANGKRKLISKTVRGSTPQGGKVVKRKTASGTVTTRTNKDKGRSSTRTSDSKGRVTGITQQKGSVKAEYGPNSKHVRAANRIRRARKKLRAGEEVKGRAGRIAKLQQQRRTDKAAGKNTKATSKKIRKAKSRMRNKMSSK